MLESASAAIAATQFPSVDRRELARGIVAAASARLASLGVDPAPDDAPGVSGSVVSARRAIEAQEGLTGAVRGQAIGIVEQMRDQLRSVGVA